MSNLTIIATPNKNPGTFTVWSKEAKENLQLDFRYLLTEFDLWYKPLWLLHYRALPLIKPSWGILDCEHLTYRPEVFINPQQNIPVRFITHSNRFLKARPTSCCVIKKDETNNDFFNFNEPTSSNNRISY